MRTLSSIAILSLLLCGCASRPAWKRQSFAFSVPDDPPSTNATQRSVGLSRVSISPLFQSRSFTYRTGSDSYEQDPYATFLIPPERMLAESIRAWMRASGGFGHVVEPGSGFLPMVSMVISINELYGDFRNPAQPIGTMSIHFLGYELDEGMPRRIIFDRLCSQQTPLTRKTPAALMAAWDVDLRQIMNQINSEYAKSISSYGQ